MNQKLLICGVVILLLLLGGLFTLSNKNSSKLSLAVLLPLTGNGSDQGEWIQNGFMLALNEVNKTNSPKIDLIFEDTKGDPKNAISAYNKLKSEFKLPVVFSWGSGVGVALTPILNGDQVVQMGVATAADSYSTLNDFTFRVFPSASQEGRFVADAILNQLKIQSVVILNVNNDYGVSSAKALEEAYEEAGGKVAGSESYEVATTDFRTLLTKIKNQSPQVIYIASYPTDGALLLKQAKDLGIKSQFIASTAILGGKNFFDVAGDAAEGLIVANSASVLDDNASEKQKHFAEVYMHTYRETPGPQQLYAARAYDAMSIVSQAINTCKENTGCIKDYLFKVKDYSGASGTITFDQNGDISANFNLQIIKNGEFVKYKMVK